jgi:hypothetical protein
VGDTFDAKAENERLRAELARARQTKVDGEAAARENAQLRALVDLNDRLQIQDMGLVAARVIGRTPNVINQVIKINQGSSDGVRPGQPVVTGRGLVGTIDTVTSNYASVTLLTDADFGAGVRSPRAASPARAPGRGRAARAAHGGHGGHRRRPPRRHVVTSGTSDPEFPSPFPPDVPDRQGHRGRGPGLGHQSSTCSPFVDVRDLTSSRSSRRWIPAAPDAPWALLALRLAALGLLASCCRSPRSPS